jgi:hypothetical protein
MRFVGDLTGDGRVDLFFLGWSGFGTMCVNQGVAAHADWTGPSFTCFGTADGLAFADVNGDGRIDVLSFDLTSFDTYTAYYSQTATYLWRLNNGDPNINTWPTTQNLVGLRPTDPNAAAAGAPFCDLNNDGIPDKIVGIPTTSRGPYATATAGEQVFLGQPNGTYTLRTGSGLESVTAPITRIEDINGDGCLDVGTDLTGYRDNQAWFIQNKTTGACNATFTATPRTALPFYPGFKHYPIDLDNSGLISQAVVIHGGYGNNDGKPGGVNLYRRLPGGGYTPITPTQSGIAQDEFYADDLALGDWNDDGKLDLGGSGSGSIAGTDAGFTLWKSSLATTNSWIKVALPAVTGFFAGAATIEVFDAGFVGDATHLVTPPQKLTTGRAWASQVYHFGIGTRSSVDVRVTFPTGVQVVRAGVAPTSRIAIQPTNNQPPTAAASATPTSVAIGQAVAFTGAASSDPDGTIAAFSWDFGDGSGAPTASASHAYASSGSFVARLTVTDNGGATASATIPISVADTVPPTVAITGGVFTPTVSDNLAVTRVEWYFDGGLSATTTTPPFSYSLNLTPVAGAHTLVARAFDAAGNFTSSAPITIQK